METKEIYGSGVGFPDENLQPHLTFDQLLEPFYNNPNNSEFAPLFYITVDKFPENSEFFNVIMVNYFDFEQEDRLLYRCVICPETEKVYLVYSVYGEASHPTIMRSFKDLVLGRAGEAEE